MANTEIAKSFKLLNPGPLDAWYGPYDSIALANQAVPSAIRLNKKVGINTDNGVVEYWWKDGVLDNDLVEVLASVNSKLTSLLGITDSIEATKISGLKSTNIPFGVKDDDQNFPFAVTEEGMTYFIAHVLSRISLGNLTNFKPISNSVFQFAFIDEAGYVGFGRLHDGRFFPFQKPAELPTVVVAQSTLFDDTYDYLQPVDTSENGIYNQWIDQFAHYYDNKLLFSSVGQGLGTSKGEQFLNLKKGDGLIRRNIIGRIRSDDKTDDHNACSVRFDNRGATNSFPIKVLQSEHNTSKMRVKRLNSYNPEKWNETAWSDLPGGFMAYAKLLQNPFIPNQWIALGRCTEAPTGTTAGTRTTRIFYSSDDCVTWLYKDLFVKSGEAWPYPLFKERETQAGVIDIAINTHPIQSSERGMFHLKLDWSTGAITNIQNPTPIISDFRTIFTDASFTGINPFTGGISMRIYTPTGDERKRMWDIIAESDENIKVLYQKIPTDAVTMANFNLGQSRVISFGKTAGVTGDTVIGETGLPNERPVGNNLYFSGLCFTDINTVILMVNKNQSMIDGGTDLSGNDGLTYVKKVNIKNLSSIVSKDVFISKNKLMRPWKVVGSPYLIYCDASKYITFRDFKCDIKVINLNNNFI
jgi:hypothetical protein